MGEWYLSEIKIFSFAYNIAGFASCNGQLLPINQNQALFALLGTTYGGNGQTTFALPNLQGRIPMHFGPGLSLGQIGGETAHTLTTSEMPAHTHQASGSSDGPTVASPAGAFFATGTGFSPYGTAPDTALSPQTVGNVGGSQPHNNMSPYLALSFKIALQGIFPSRN
jgi:microcystin-dependent protein